ncbi:YicC family protein [Chromatiales bacterium (ex Bugula neritina AB1)]|nr:YicC family protein [Chromatiales bacterium (ex Bugula neritina AB1)]
MLKSMTAYSRQEVVTDAGSFVWEMRSVNHRYLDISLRLPEDFRAIEAQVREKLTRKLSRGKVEASLRFRPSGAIAGQITVNEVLAQQLIDAALAVQKLTGTENSPPAMEVLRWPGVVGQAETDHGPLQQQAMSLLETLIEDYLATRGREGDKTAEMLKERCDEIEKIVARVRLLRPQALERQRKKLIGRIESLEVEHDNSRLEQELVFVAQKLDVDEELDRLTAHLSELRDILQRDEPVGRRLDFLVQEFNREANTLGSKSADSDTTSLAVDLKVLIEQMREQIQNIE